MEPAVELTKVDFPLYESNAADNEWHEVSQKPQEAFETEHAEGKFEESEEGEVACARCR